MVGKRLTAVIRFPGADYTQRSVLAAARRVLPSTSTSFVTDIEDGTATEELCSQEGEQILFFCDYDLLPFEGLLRHSDRLLCSSYVIRKALIRKHYLAHALHSYQLKQGGDEALPAKEVTPRTWHIEINFADELDELLLDDLYDLNAELEDNEGREPVERKWFILKPAMADRGNGIRLFDSLEQLQNIFEVFEEADDDNDDDDDDAEQAEQEQGQANSNRDRDTAVITSQLRHFVIQEYVSSPLLLCPTSPSQPALPRKFHLRAYVLCVGALKVYLADEMLALFAPLPYSRPGADHDESHKNDSYASDDLRRHLTNTCLQSEGPKDGTSKVSEENVFLFSELQGMPFVRSQGQSTANIPSETIASDSLPVLSNAHLTQIKEAAVDVLATTFTACATTGTIHWQMWPNAFEIFGIDLLVESTGPSSSDTDKDAAKDEFKVLLLEINAQPDFAQSGSRLEPTIEHLFGRTFELAVQPFFDKSDSVPPSTVGQSDSGMTLCLDLQLSKAW
ncbi:hypothetical protein CF326_g8 [Tilletia indica]|nr:hypothetical protein CF326_g8 [Tilletia indica]